MTDRLEEADLLGLRWQRSAVMEWRRGPGGAGLHRCEVVHAEGYPVKARWMSGVVIGVEDDVQRRAGRGVLWRQLVTVSVKFWVTVPVELVAVMAMV